MSTLSELRMARSDDSSVYTDDRVLTDKRYERVSGARTPTYRGELLHYRDDFGMTMDDSQYKYASDEKKTNEDKISKAQAEIDKSRSSADSQYKSGLKQINEASTELPAYNFEGFYKGYLKNTAIPISIYNGSSYEGTYLMDPTSASSFLGSVKSTEYYRIFTNDKGQTSIDVRGYGKELHEPLLEYSNKLQPTAKEAYDKEYKKAVGDINKATSIEKQSATNLLNSGYSGAQATLAQQQQQLNDIQTQNTNYYQSIKDKYKDKLSNIKDTIFSLT